MTLPIMPRVMRSAFNTISRITAPSHTIRTLATAASPLQADVQPTTGPSTGGATAKKGRSTLSPEQQQYLDSAVSSP